MQVAAHQRLAAGEAQRADPHLRQQHDLLTSIPGIGDLTAFKLLAEIVEEMRGKGIDKPVVVSLAGDVEVEEASEYLFDHKIPAYPYSTEIPVDVLGAKYKWARGAGLL